ncbi:peptidase M6 [Rhizocola hellebori]|uniref:Peptidase M6 n=1 Tax=Rhizocola hellebori TaxID=1392758 RepID=A0A8J3VHC4_9ACTN|nr:M6 family metalloprotease domain-containing protein [Rhizocola hellebori]GIH06102.1 peptidase M6 [Rhizocola hellebori]
MITWRRGAASAAAVTLVLGGMVATPATAAADPPPAPTPNPWQMRHWPQTQPWQRAQAGPRIFAVGEPQPIDPQNFEQPDTMTWDDYRAVPGTNWADPAVRGSVRTFKGALVLIDYPNQPFAVTQPANSTIYGNPTTVHDVPRAQVPEFYRSFLNVPSELNRGHTIHEYWMEDSGGRLGIELSAFGVYQMPAKSHEYGIADFQRGAGCPAGDTCQRNPRTDARAAWIADIGPDVAAQYEFIFYLSAGQDESSTWQEFGEMKFRSKEEVTPQWGPPDPALPKWNFTRYIEWTSWQASANLWPNAGGGSSTQAESSGMSVFAHEFSHILGIGDNYNNPYSVPARRAYSGPWEMLDRGTFNGPGGPHSRWLIPATAGASMGAQHMLRNKMKLGIVDEQNVLRLSRDALAGSGVVVAQVTARSVRPGAAGLSGLNVALDGGDRSLACDVNADPLCDGGGYNNYTVEVIDRMGFDSFTPDSGVLLAKTKDRDAAPFIWTVDANPQDIDQTDFVRPDGTQQKMTIGDYRQLSDALFHAGTESGSEYEYVDQANRLHVYVLGLHRDSSGVLTYTVAVRSLDGSGPHERGVAVSAAAGVSPPLEGWTTCTVPVHNTGRAGAVPPGHPEDVAAYANSDVYRITAAANGTGWTTFLPATVVSAGFGQTVPVLVYVKRSPGALAGTQVRVTATSESDPTKTATATCRVLGRAFAE